MNTNNYELRSIYRTQLLSLVFCFLALIIFGRLVYLQIYKHNYFIEQAQNQYTTKNTSAFDRGNIFFSHYKSDLVPAAQLESVYTIAIDPAHIKDKDKVFNTINTLIPIDKDSFYAKANKVNDPYEEITKNVKEDVVILLKENNFVGVSFIKENQRAYPQNDVGSKVIGFVGFNENLRSGRYGVERFYDDVLSRGRERTQTNFFAQLFADIQDSSVSNDDSQEGDVVLTVDAEVERFLHTTLLDTEKSWKGDIVGGIIMDPNTGAIIAMDAIPSYNPNSFGDVKDQNYFDNQLVSGVYEMGSIIKPLTIAAGLDSGVIDENTTYNDTGFRMLDGYKVKNYDGKARGITPIQTILDKSLNVGIVFTVEKLGTQLFQQYFKKYGFGSETGIDLPSESAGLVRNLDSKVFVDSATAGFGQGFASTPIQTIRALAVLGNGGKLVNPHIVDSVMYKNGNIKKIVPDDAEQIFKPETSEKISRMLVHVVDTALLNGKFKMDHYSIAAKTGTAQMVKPGGGYYDDRYLHSFFGYFPAYDPKFIIFLFHTHPKGAEYASATLTDPFFKLTKFLLSYYEVTPDR